MKKIVVCLTVLITAVCLVAGFVLVVQRSQSIRGQTKPTPTGSAPAAPQPDSSAPASVNRPVSRWVTTNMIMLNTLLHDSKKLEYYVSEMNLDYAEQTCQQIRCDINTMRGVPPPNTRTDTYYFPPGEVVGHYGGVWYGGEYGYGLPKQVYLPQEEKMEYLWSPIPRAWMMWERLARLQDRYSYRYLQGAPSGVECPPIPDLEASATLNAGLYQLELAVNHMENGINDSQEGLLLGLEGELKAANATLEQVLKELGQQ